MPRPELERYQEAALDHAIRHAFHQAPLIGGLWKEAGIAPSDIRSMADFTSKVPFMSKDSLRSFRDRHGDPLGGMYGGEPGEVVAVETTSGTTGDPTALATGWVQTDALSYARDLWQIGLRPGDYHLHILMTYRGGHRRHVLPELGIGEIHVSMSRTEMPRLCEASRRFRPTTMSVIANPFILALEEHFEQSGEDPVDTFSSYKGAIFGGEPLGNRLKALTGSWGLELFETTALGDVCGASECRAHDGMHAYEDFALIECIDPMTLEPVPDGQVGELVVTALHKRFSPFMRYRTDDLVVLDRSPCRCGRTHARFKLLGRVGDQIVVRGRSILPRELLTHIEVQSETRAGLFQIVRATREMDRLHLRVGYDESRLSTGEKALADRLTDILTDALDVPVHIELTSDHELLKLGPPHKIPRVTKA